MTGVEADRGWRGLATMVLQFAGLIVFALVGPFLSLLQTGPTFLVAQGLSGAGLVLYVLAWLVVPAAVLASVVWLVGRLRSSVGAALRTVAVGALAGLAVVGLLPGSLQWSSLLFVVVWGAAAVVAGLAFARVGVIRSLVTASAVAVPVFAVGFLASSSVRPLLATETATAEVVDRGDNPVVFLVFDEMGLGTILTPEGEINGALFPNFARLAATSTWYPNASTVAPSTSLAVPALLTGQYPEEGSIPSAAVWPDNLLTMLGGGDRVLELSTALCPSELCAQATPGGTQLLKDSVSVLVNAVLPRPLAARVVPPLSDQWARFGEDAEGEQGANVDLGEVGEGDAGSFQREVVQRARERIGGASGAAYAAVFVDRLEGIGGGDLAFAHFNVPHLPLRFVADGTRYNEVPPGWFSVNPGWTGTDASGQVSARQRLVLQTMFVDRILGEVLDALERQGVLDETLLVVSSDHGVTTEPNSHRRGTPAVSAEVYDDAIPVPLFVKAPRQTDGVRDSRDVRTIDVLPTVIDLLGIEGTDAWGIDGVSLLGEPVEGRPRQVASIGELPRTPSAVASAQRQWEALGALALDGAIYAIGPHADLVGRSIDDPLVAASLGRSLDAPVAPWRNVDPASGELPLLISVPEPPGVERGDWIVAILNGVVAGVGPVFLDGEGRLRADAMVNPQEVVRGANDLRVHVIDAP